MPTTLYSSTSTDSFSLETVLYKTTDGGDSWQFLTLDVGPVVVDPHDSATIYGPETRIRTDFPEGPGTSGIAKSTDGGQTWTVTDIAANAATTQVVVDPITSTTLYAVTTRGIRTPLWVVWKSTDGGGSWVPVVSSEVDVFGVLAIDPAAPDTIYLRSRRSGILKSTDGGSTWTAINNGLPTIDVNALAIDPLASSTLYLGGVGLGQSGGVFKSTDGGSSWVPLNESLTDRDVNDLEIDAHGVLHAATGSGLFVLRQPHAGPALNVSPESVARGGVVTAS